MRTLRFLVILLLGVGLGAGLTWAYCRQAMIAVKTDANLELTRQSLLDTVVGLKLVRGGRIDEFLEYGEQNINTYISALVLLADEYPHERTNRLYSAIARYRSEHPYQSSEAEVDQQVEDFLAANIDKQKSGQKTN